MTVCNQKLVIIVLEKSTYIFYNLWNGLGNTSDVNAYVTDDLLVPNVENETVTSQTNNCNDTIDQRAEENNTLTGNFILSPMT